MHLAVWVQSISTTRMYPSTQEQSLLQSAYNRAKLDFSPDWNLVTSHHGLELSFYKSILEPGRLKFKIWHADVVSSFPTSFYKFFSSSYLPKERWGAVLPPDTSWVIFARDTLHHSRGTETVPVLTRVQQTVLSGPKARSPPQGLPISNLKDTKKFIISETICYSKMIFIQHRKSKYVEVKAK